MKKNINLNPITYTCICKKAIWETYSLSDRKNISINICSACQTLSGKGDMKMKNIDKFKERLRKKMEKENAYVVER